jgi:hypothetical protein
VSTPTLVVFAGGFGTHPAERLVDQARLAATLDALEAWLTHNPAHGNAILVTDDPNILQGQSLPGLTIDADDGPYHFGRRLAGVIRRHNLEAVIYVGAGSVPFFTVEDFANSAAPIAQGVAVTNNLYSSDMVAFPVREEALKVISTLDRDNALARALHEQASIRVKEPRRTIATQFDIDAPTDVAVLSLVAGVPVDLPRGIPNHALGPRLRGQVATIAGDIDRYRALLPVFLDATKQLLVAGRVGSHAWRYLERETACRVRLFAEERGMEADNRADKGLARSLLGLHIEAVGVDRFFAELPELCDAALIDTRVLLAHNRITASRSDRFLSDLGQPEQIEEPFLRDFTRAALHAPIPVLLGGHSLMSGDLMLLNEHAWSLRDAGKM